MTWKTSFVQVSGRTRAFTPRKLTTESPAETYRDLVSFSLLDPQIVCPELPCQTGNRGT